MGYVVNPEQIKRREYLGLTALSVGTLVALAGLISLIFLVPLGLILFGLGAAGVTAGIYILNQIPDVLANTDDFTP